MANWFTKNENGEFELITEDEENRTAHLGEIRKKLLSTKAVDVELFDNYFLIHLDGGKTFEIYSDSRLRYHHYED